MLPSGEPELLRRTKLFWLFCLTFPLVRSCKILCCHNIHASVSPVPVVTLVDFLVQGSIFSVLFPNSQLQELRDCVRLTDCFVGLSIQALYVFLAGEGKHLMWFPKSFSFPSIWLIFESRGLQNKVSVVPRPCTNHTIFSSSAEEMLLDQVPISQKNFTSNWSYRIFLHIFVVNVLSGEVSDLWISRFHFQY